MTGAVATVGTFDGIHRGHQAVLAAVVRRARASGAPSMLVTFDPHPLAVVTPSAAPRLLTLPDEKVVHARAAGVDRVETLAFTPELARLGPEEFVRDVLLARLGVQALVVGYDHGFGRDRAGDVELVRQLARAHGFALDVVDAVTDGGPPISSSLIRTAVMGGDLLSAEHGLGRRYSLRAPVTRGAGPRPTFGVHARGLEIHLFDFRGDLYDQVVTVEWVRRLRDVQTFASRQALVDQIERDAVAARSALKG